MIEGAAKQHRALFSYALDCGDLPGLALAALRAGLPGVVLRGPPRIRAQVAEVAAQLGAIVLKPPQALDLGLSQSPAKDIRVVLGDAAT